MSSDPTAFQWAASEIKRIHAFLTFWKQGQDTQGKEIFPDTMSAGDWDEQFRFWDGE